MHRKPPSHAPLCPLEVRAQHKFSFLSVGMAESDLPFLMLSKQTSPQTPKSLLPVNESEIGFLSDVVLHISQLWKQPTGHAV
jgi:hypothetical protein